MVYESPAFRVQDTLAQNLRRLRIARHQSLSELARATRMSKATLSSIESGRSNPTVDTLASLASVLKVSLAELLEEPPVGRIQVLRRTPGGGSPRRVLEQVGAPGGFGIIEMEIPAWQLQERDSAAAGSRAHVYVLAGKLVSGPAARVTELDAGDYASFPIDVPHVYETTHHPARALIIEAKF